MVPVVETERLRLRGFRESDLDPQAEIMGDPKVVHYLGGKPLAREEAWRRACGGHALWDILGYGYWAVERKEDGAYVGLAGFADFKRDMLPSIEGVPEMGWIFASFAHGQGYATEAVLGGLGWVDRELPGREIAAIIHPDNAPSIRVAEKAGFSTRQEAAYRGNPILLFRRQPVR